jgi:hypothetical protein
MTNVSSLRAARVHASSTLRRLWEEHDCATEPRVREALNAHLSEIEPCVALLDSVARRLVRPVRSTAATTAVEQATVPMLTAIYEAIVTFGDEIAMAVMEADDRHADLLIEVMALARAERESFGGEVRRARELLGKSKAMRRDLEALGRALGTTSYLQRGAA